MKPYGHKKEDGRVDTHANCPCCVSLYNRKRLCRKVADMRRRKTERQAAKTDIVTKMTDD